MKTIEISIELDDILRERIDEVATYKRNLKISKDLYERWKSDKELSEDEYKQIYDFLLAISLKIFLYSKETLIIPEDAFHRFAQNIVKNLDDLQIKFAYQDFYAYQFVDKLQYIVSRALRIREVFAKKNVSEEIKTICKEAYLCFIQGYHVASIALCRSIVEVLLKERLNVEIGELGKLNDIAYDRGIYSKGTWDRINQIRRRGNEILHEIAKGKSPSEYDNLKILRFTQEILQTLMS